MLERLWYRKSGWRWLLAPFALLFAIISGTRRYAYRHGWRKGYRSSLPVIVVGNISVGGNGKTPVVVWLVEQLQARGYRPGVVSRGYGGKAPHYPYRLDETSTTAQAGDEPVLIARRCGCPVVVAPKRADAVRLLEQSGEVDIIITDDGLQHYALARDIELVVVDGARRFGNACLLPMGPLREPVTRLKRVDAIICNGSEPGKGSTPCNWSPTPRAGCATMPRWLPPCRGRSMRWLGSVIRPASLPPWKGSAISWINRPPTAIITPSIGMSWWAALPASRC